MAGPGQNRVSIAPAKGGSYNQPKQDDRKIDVKSSDVPPSIYTSSPAPVWSSTASGISGLPSSPVPFDWNIVNPFSMEEWTRKALEEQARNQQLARDAALAMDTGDVAERRLYMGENSPTEAVTNALQTPQSVTDWMAQANALLGAGPNYEEYRNRLADEIARTNARAAAMYKELAKETDANVGRVKDIYSDSGSELDNIYRQAQADVAGAYQQASKARGGEAERLGIQEAFAKGAPSDIRAEGAAVSDLAKGRAAGLGNLVTKGAASAGRVGEMANVYQQRGGEWQADQLANLNQMLAQNVFQQEQQRYNAQLQAPALAKQLYEASMLGVDTGPTYDQQLKAAQIEADIMSGDAQRVANAQQAKADLALDIARSISETTGKWPDAATIQEAYNSLIGTIYG